MDQTLALDGASMKWPWALPFVGILLSIAIGPSLFPRVWHAHYGKIALFWAALTLAFLAALQGIPAALATSVHVTLTEYMSFIILLFALYTVAGGIQVTGTLQASPWTNTATLALSTAAASAIGTTGAALIVIRPLIRANQDRSRKVHVVIFAIILVANVGGALTPLGDPPLLIGFLHGVTFWWTAQHLWRQTIIVAGLLLFTFLALDSWYFRKEAGTHRVAAPDPLQVRGLANFALLGVVIATVLASAAWKSGIVFDVYGSKVELEHVLRDGTLVLVALASLWLTPDEHRAGNDFSWEPICEVAIIFAGTFVAIAPVMAMLQAGRAGAFAFLLQAVTARDGSAHQAAYFWLTGGLSAFLDNAPTYLAFFELAGGDASQLMGRLEGTLASISMGAVFMGALTYIGNAPNLIVCAIAEGHGINMPSFFGYLLWAAAILVPLLALLTLLPISPLLKL